MLTHHDYIFIHREPWIFSCKYPTCLFNQFFICLEYFLSSKTGLLKRNYKCSVLLYIEYFSKMATREIIQSRRLGQVVSLEVLAIMYETFNIPKLKKNGSWTRGNKIKSLNKKEHVWNTIHCISCYMYIYTYNFPCKKNLQPKLVSKLLDSQPAAPTHTHTAHTSKLQVTLHHLAPAATHASSPAPSSWPRVVSQLSSIRLRRRR